VRFTIFDKYPNGSSQYSEVHTTTTDDYGVFNLIIGQGSSLSGDFGTIPWELGDAHLQVEIDFENTNTFTLTALEKFWSVPYAFVTNETGTSSTDSSLAALNNKFQYLKDRDKDTVIGNEGISYQALDSLNNALKAEIAALRFSDKDTVIGNELQTLSVTGDSVTISEGNTVVINHPANLDNDSTNEIQTISLSNDTIHLSKGGGKIALKDINDYIRSQSTSSGNQSKSMSVFSGNKEVKGTRYTFGGGIPCYGDTSNLDTLNLLEGDRVVLYTNSDGYRYETGITLFVDSAFNSVSSLNIVHGKYADGSAPTGQSSWGYNNFNSSNGGGSMVSIKETRIQIPYDGIYYIRCRSRFCSKLTDTWTVGQYYYEIN
jgi:hypothetical protein